MRSSPLKTLRFRPEFPPICLGRRGHIENAFVKNSFNGTDLQTTMHWNGTELEQAAAEQDGRLPLETENLKQSKATENLFDTEFRRKGRLLKLKKSNDKIKKQFSYFTVCGTR